MSGAIPPRKSTGMHKDSFTAQLPLSMPLFAATRCHKPRHTASNRTVHSRKVT